MFDALSDKLQRVFSRLSSHGTVTEKDLDEALREVRVALLEADVNFRVVREFVAAVRERAVGAEVLKSLTGPQQVIAIVNEELTKMLGGSQATLDHGAPAAHRRSCCSASRAPARRPSPRSWRCTCASTAASRCSSPPTPIASPPASSCRRSAASTTSPVFAGDLDDLGEARAQSALAEARRIGATAVIVDSAGYLQLDEDVIEELQALRDALQAARDAARRRRDDRPGGRATSPRSSARRRRSRGFVLTKLDGDARGGAALSIRAITGLPIKFIGTGERADALEPFHPERFASRILGMGDVLTLIEKAQRADRRGGRRRPRQAHEGEPDWTSTTSSSSCSGCARWGRWATCWA